MSERHDWELLFGRLFTTPAQINPRTGKLFGDRASMTTDEQSAVSVNEMRVLGLLPSDIGSERIASGLPQRLHASRLRAAFPTAESAALQIGVQGRNYRAVENGTRKPSPRVVGEASYRFDVSLEYLLIAVPHRPTDVEAAELEKIIEDLKSKTWSDDKTIGARLQRARRAAGFRSADEALAQFNWKPSAYKGHEAGFKPIPLDRLVLYSGMLGVDARLLAFGGAENSSSDAVARTGSVKNAEPVLSRSLSRPPPWPWLIPKALNSDVMTVQVLRTADDGTLVPARFPLTIPAGAAPVPSGSDTIFAVLATDREASAGADFLILQPYRNEASVADLVVSDGQRILSGVSVSERLVYGDPLTVQGSSDRPIVLGRLIGEFTLRWATVR